MTDHGQGPAPAPTVGSGAGSARSTPSTYLPVSRSEALRASLSLAAYTAAWRLGWPLAALYLAWRGWRQRAYLRHWGERFLGSGPAFPAVGFVASLAEPAAGEAAGPVVWVHAVSVGETRAAQPLVEALARHDPSLRILLTHMTPTGREAGAALARALPGRVVQRYLPYDLPGAVRRFLAQTRPALGLLLETEAWPNLLAGAQRAGVPVVLVNARLSERSLQRALRRRALFRRTASRLERIVAQTDADRARLAQLYDGPIDVAGNLKFDLDPSPAQLDQGRQWRQQLGDRRVWLFANTREGEEAALTQALARLDASRTAGTSAGEAPAVRVFVPRHPQRFDEVARAIAAAGHALVRRSDPRGWGQVPPGAYVLGDSMGEMAMYYAAADVAVVCGSFERLGGHNLIEACAAGCAVVVGPHTFNFAQATADAVQAGAALQVADADAAVAAVAALDADPARLAAMRESARAFAAAHRGATSRTVAIVGQLLARRVSGPAAR